jgi:hypothetical protein
MDPGARRHLHSFLDAFPGRFVGRVFGRLPDLGDDPPFGEGRNSLEKRQEKRGKDYG